MTGQKATLSPQQEQVYRRCIDAASDTGLREVRVTLQRDGTRATKQTRLKRLSHRRKIIVTSDVRAIPSPKLTRDHWGQ